MALGNLKLDGNDKFTDIDPESLPDELKGMYKNMQTHFTEKTTLLADAQKQISSESDVHAKDKREFEDEITKLRAERDTLQTSISGKEKDDDVLSFLDDLEFDDDNSNNSNQDNKVQKALLDKIDALGETVKGLKTDLEDKTSHVMKVQRYQADLGVIENQHKDEYGKPMVRQELIDYAVKEGIPDLFRAYDSFTQEIRIDKKATEKADELFKTRMEKDETFGTGMTGAGTPRIFARNEEAPKTMTEATKNILKELRTKT